MFSLLRLADARVHSSGYWIFRDYIAGMESFHQATAGLAAGDFSPYEKGIPGLCALNEGTVVFRLARPYPRLLHVLAMPYCSILPERATRFYGERLSEHPVGSGPFFLSEWRRNYRLILDRNPAYRAQSIRVSTPRT